MRDGHEFVEMVVGSMRCTRSSGTASKHTSIFGPGRKLYLFRAHKPFRASRTRRSRGCSRCGILLDPVDHDYEISHYHRLWNFTKLPGVRQYLGNVGGRSCFAYRFGWAQRTRSHSVRALRFPLRWGRRLTFTAIRALPIPMAADAGELRLRPLPLFKMDKAMIGQSVGLALQRHQSEVKLVE